MPLKLTTTINKILSVSNHTNKVIINDFCEYMKSSGCSEHHQNNNLKVVVAFAKFLGHDSSFYDIKQKGTNYSIFRYKDKKYRTGS